MGPGAKRIFGSACIEKKVRLLVEVFRLFENFILKLLFFCNRALELSKANKKKPRSPTFCVGPGAKRIFGSSCIEKKVRLLVEVFRLFENFILKLLFFAIGS